MPEIRPAAVAGTFYPAREETLRADVDALLELQPNPSGTPAPKALIVPHAGYIYSGPIAATAYRRLAGAARQIRKVVLLGPVHRVPVRGLALPSANAFATPIGTVHVDREAAGRALTLPQVVVSDAAHTWEHSLEVQLPFLLRILEDFRVLPLAVGDATPQQVAEVVELLWGGPETLILVSSDLSHYLPYETARRTDGATAEAILGLKGPISHDQACGGTPVNGLLLAARNHGMRPELLDLRNSGDTAGDRSHVVGYGAFAFYEGSAS